MTTHELKILPEHYSVGSTGSQEGRKAELRKYDRDFQAGDQLVLRCWDRVGGVYTGHSVSEP